MFISALELFKIGICPLSSHALGPIVAARVFIEQASRSQLQMPADLVRCTLKGLLAITDKGHSTDPAVALGLHGYLPEQLAVSLTE